MLGATLSLLLCLSELSDAESLRFRYTAEQGYDSSCGLSALVSFLHLSGDNAVTEAALGAELLSGRAAAGDYTVSFTDLKRLLAARGYTVAAFAMDFPRLEGTLERYAPLIVHYDRPEGHFVLLLGAADGFVVVADPAEGTIELDRAAFESQWSGKILIAAKPGGGIDRDHLAAAIASARARRDLALAATAHSLGGLPW